MYNYMYVESMKQSAKTNLFIRFMIMVGYIMSIWHLLSSETLMDKIGNGFLFLIATIIFVALVPNMIKEIILILDPFVSYVPLDSMGISSIVKNDKPFLFNDRPSDYITTENVYDTMFCYITYNGELF